MKQMTYAEALNIVKQTIEAINLTECGFTTEQREKVVFALARIEALRKKYSTPRPSSDEAKAKRRAKSAQEREALVAEISPIVMSAMTMEEQTAAEIYNKCVNDLPNDWSIPKVQYLLLHELASVIDKIEVKGKPNTYRLPA